MGKEGFGQIHTAASAAQPHSLVTLAQKHKAQLIASLWSKQRHFLCQYTCQCQRVCSANNICAANKRHVLQKCKSLDRLHRDKTTCARFGKLPFWSPSLAHYQIHLLWLENNNGQTKLSVSSSESRTASGVSGGWVDVAWEKAGLPAMIRAWTRLNHG